MDKSNKRSELIERFNKINEDFKNLNPEGPTLLSIFKAMIIGDIQNEIDSIYKDLITNGFTYKEIIDLIKE